MAQSRAGGTSQLDDLLCATEVGGKKCISIGRIMSHISSAVPDGGEPIGNPKKETRDQFAEYFNQVL